MVKYPMKVTFSQIHGLMTPTSIYHPGQEHHDGHLDVPLDDDDEVV